jgi:ubiquitin C-terminal hydrolase
LSSLVAEFKRKKVGALLQLKNSTDPSVSENLPTLKAGRKWSPSSTLSDAEADVRVSEMTGKVCDGRSGLGFSRGRVKTVSRKIGDAVSQQENQGLYAKAVQQSLQGQWTRWSSIVQRDMNWHTLLRSSPSILSFSFGATFETLGTPKNLSKWGLVESDKCPLCGVDKCGLPHILSGCSVSLGSGKYRYRHDQVLKSIANDIQSEINYLKGKVKRRRKGGSNIVFVREGCQSNTRQTPTPKEGILERGKDWNLLTDLGKQLKFPTHIIITSLRPDLVIFSDSSKILIIIELTCPCEENIDCRHTEKTIKYSDLVADCIRRGWKVFFFAVEVGARGFASNSLKTCFSRLGFSGRKNRTALERAAAASLRASFWIYMKREGTENGQKKTFTRTAKRVNSISASKSVPNNVSVQVKQLVRNPRGIVNLGNSCYVNAVLQALSVVKPSSSSSNDLNRLLFDTLRDLSSNTSTPLYPIALISEIRSTLFPASNTQFQDAHEFLQKVSEVINSSSFDINVSEMSKCSSCSVSSSRVESLFGLQFPIPAVNSDLQQLIDRAFDPQVGLPCTVCSHTSCTTTRVISSTPQILVLHLCRFDAGNVRKIDSVVQFPFENLRLPSLPHFRLAAVVDHHGSPLSGHYTASVCREGKWFSCNDTTSVSIDHQKAISKSAYILFYLPM